MLVFWIVHSGYHPLKHRPLTMAFGWYTVDIILLTIVLFGWCFGWCTVGYHPLKHRPVKVVFWMVHSGYHPLKTSSS